MIAAGMAAMHVVQPRAAPALAINQAVGPCALN